MCGVSLRCYYNGLIEIVAVTLVYVYLVSPLDYSASSFPLRVSSTPCALKQNGCLSSSSSSAITAYLSSSSSSSSVTGSEYLSRAFKIAT